ncbi:MAG: thiamine pyrophosphate-binding protein [Paracoccaceae bacterium]|nr:thiamine pyrophosphate-binding protein [Paracoccaceae bacterium]
MAPRAAEILVKALQLHGVERIFAVPGESYLSVLDALVDAPDIQLVTTRHEGGAGFMALADARLSGRAGVAFVSRGPGAMNAAIAVHTAQQDALPLLLFVGQVERPHLGLGAFQEVDYTQVFGSMAKWVVSINDATRLADTVATAFHRATSGTPGPVIVALPEDMLDDMVADAAPIRRTPVRAAASTADLATLLDKIAAAERPLIIAGPMCQNSAGRAALCRVAELFGLPVATSVRQADLIDNDHPQFAGHLAYGAPAALVSALSRSDLIIAIGSRLGDVTSQGYTMPRAPIPAQPVIQILPEPSEVGRIRNLALGIAADPVVVLEQMAAARPPQPDTRHLAWSTEMHAVVRDLRRWDGPDDAEDGVVFGAFMRDADALIAEDAIISTDAGNFAAWVQKLIRFGGGRRLVAPTSGAMGFGVPGAVSASLRFPGRQVVGFVGDGGLMMTGNELATALQFGATPVLVVSDNGSYGTIRMHQERNFPGRLAMTTLINPDFHAWAESFGALSLKVDTAADGRAALQTALTCGRAAVITVRTSLNFISPATTIAALNPPT